MTATIHPLHGEVQSPGEQRSYWDHIHEIAMIRLRYQYQREWSRKFAQDVMDYAAQSGDAYLALCASNFLEQLEKAR